MKQHTEELELIVNSLKAENSKLKRAGKGNPVFDTDIHDDNAKLRVELDRAKNKIRNLESGQGGLNTGIKETQYNYAQKLQSLEKENEQLKRQLSNADNISRALGSDLELQLRQENQSYLSQITELRAKLTEKERVISTLKGGDTNEEALNNLKKQNQKLAERLQEMELMLQDSSFR